MGGDLEYADELTLGRALEGRRADRLSAGLGRRPTPDGATGTVATWPSTEARAADCVRDTGGVVGRDSDGDVESGTECRTSRRRADVIRLGGRHSGILRSVPGERSRCVVAVTLRRFASG